MGASGSEYGMSTIWVYIMVLRVGLVGVWEIMLQGNRRVKTI